MKRPRVHHLTWTLVLCSAAVAGWWATLVFYGADPLARFRERQALTNASAELATRAAELAAGRNRGFLVLIVEGVDAGSGDIAYETNLAPPVLEAALATIAKSSRERRTAPSADEGPSD